jgi:phosphatidylserine/phosphatidylglycerophosphate/cardiolipin synthase-like enzyme
MPVSPVNRVSPTAAATPPAPVSAQDQALIQAIGSAKTRVLLNLSRTPSSAVAAAIVTALKQGLDVKVVLNPAAGFDSTWTFQQRLESTGADVDVRDDNPLGNVQIVTDDVGVDADGKPMDASAVQQTALKFAMLFTSVSPDTKPTVVSGPDQLELHPMPESRNQWIADLIGRAHTTIDLEIYQLQDDDVTGALEAASKRGVKVRVMLEPKTVGAQNFDREAAELKAAGVDVQPTPPTFDSAHNVDHAKFMVVDGTELLFGTGNLVRSGLGGDTDGPFDNRDFWVEDSRGESVHEGQTLFGADWARQDTSKLDFTNFVLTPDNADQRILALIDSAQKRLYVYNQELNDPDVIQHLLAAKKRGVDVQVLLGYQPGFGGPPPNQAALQQLQQAGVQAAYLKSHYLHAKGIVSDDSAYLGSQNFTSGGLKNNRELGEILQGPVVDQVVSTFQTDFAANKTS